MKKNVLKWAGVAVWLLCLTAPAAIQAHTPGAQAESPRNAHLSIAPVMEVGEAGFDFGEAVEGEVITHQYSVKNTGTADLQITRVRAG